MPLFRIAAIRFAAASRQPRNLATLLAKYSKSMTIALGGAGASIIADLRLSVIGCAGSGLRGLSVLAGALPAFSRTAVFALKIGFILSPLALVVFLVVCAISNPYVRTGLAYAHERSSAIEVFDSDDRWIGILPPASFADWSDGSLLAPDHAAVPLTSIPPVWRQCIAYLEDRTAFDGLSRWLGIDPLALLKGGVETISGNRRRGASTLYMQLVRTLNGQSPDPEEPLGNLALRKLAELVGATALAQMLRERDPHLAERYVGMHLPLMIGASGSAFGDAIHGVALSARLLFGKPAEALAIEEQAILAAAVKSPILMAPPGNEAAQNLAYKRWARIKLRAEHCLANAFPPDAPGIAAARSRLEKLQLPAPAIDPALAAALPADPRSAWQITVNPVRRVRYFAVQELALAKIQLDRALGTDWRGRVVSIHLTTSAADNRNFKDAIVGALKELQASVPGIGMSLYDGVGIDNAAHVVVALADPDGRLRYVYSSHDGLLLTRKAEMGSTAKMLAAVALARRNSPQTPYCRAPIPGMSVAVADDKSVCRDRTRWLPAHDAFARSSSPAIHWALRHYCRQGDLKSIAAAFGLPALGDVPPTTALTYGVIEITPAEMLRMTAGVGAVLAGEHRDIPFPSIVAEAVLLDPDGKTRSVKILGGESLSSQALAAAVPSGAKAFVANVLGATSEASGTLRSLAPVKAELGGMLYAKTGTVSVAGNTQVVQIAGVFMRAGRPWSFTVMLATPDSRRPLGRNLAASQFASLAAVVLGRFSTKGPKKGTPAAMARDQYARHHH